MNSLILKIFSLDWVSPTLSWWESPALSWWDQGKPQATVVIQASQALP